MNDEKKKSLGLAAFIPMIVFLVLYIGSGIYFTIQGGVDRPWGQFPRETAIFVGIIVACIMCRDISLNDKIDTFTKHAGSGSVMLMVLIFLLAGAFSAVADISGAASSVVNLGLSLIPSNLMLAGMFIMSAIIATAMGSSSGTLVIVGPIAMSVAQQLGASIELYFAAVWGGALFGDNLSVISDTTIAACNGAGCGMREKFKMNFLIALPAAIVTIVVYAVLGGHTSAVIEGDLSYRLIDIIPYAFVLITAIAGMNVIACLASGVFLAGLIGILTGEISLIQFVQAVGTGMGNMNSMAIICVLLAGLIGVVQLFGGVDWLVGLIRKNIRTRKGAELSIGLLCGLLDFALLANTLSIVITSPISKEISEEYHIAPKRNASLMDIFACVFLGFMPHGNYMFTMTGFYPDLNPFEVIRNQYYCVFLLIAVLVTIFLGLGRTKEEKEAARQLKAN